MTTSNLRNVHVATATSTLAAAGYEITDSQRSPRYIELSCQRVNALGALVRVLVAITDELTFSTQEIEDLGRMAASQGRALVLVGRDSSASQISWDYFLEALGGAIPSWRVLAEFYASWLRSTANNVLPQGADGEAWQVFEDLVADGLGFLFGRRIRQLGARRRGRPVSDMLAALPDFQQLVVDTKATGGSFDASPAELRPLAEYARNQRQRQRGQAEVIAALVVSSRFKQDPDGLTVSSRWFQAESHMPLCFLTADVLTAILQVAKSNPGVRAGIRWNHVFSGGAVELAHFKSEVQRAIDERYSLEP